ncbi:hypothetical protein [Peribacillus frigoritolerans]|uniref:Uncharacterized protein n=1 Tax=Peribacillus castrilensis TaxID=2897690 RepID=A0AAW9NLM6_9BACI|nr:hypothetical protein [Peribacillus castrilensis]
MSTVMQDHFENAVNEAVKMALLQEIKEIKKQVFLEIEESTDKIENRTLKSLVHKGFAVIF